MKILLLTLISFFIVAEDKQLKRITVTGDSSEYVVPGSADLITGKELEQAKSGSSDINRVLKQVPGVNVVEEDGFGLRPNIGLRGVSSERSANITLMEDGVLIAPAPYSASAAYVFPSMGRMSGLEVLKGASQIKYGPRTTGGSINLLSTPIPQDQAFNLDLRGGSFDTFLGHMNFGKSYTYGGFLLETYQADSNGFKELDGGGNTGFSVQDYVGKFKINTDAKKDNYQELELKVGDYSNQGNETYVGITQDDFKSNPNRRYFASRNDKINSDAKNYSLKHYGDFGSFDLTTTAYFNDTHRNWKKLEKVNGNDIADIFDSPNEYLSELDILKGAESDIDAIKLRENNRLYNSRGIQSVLGKEFSIGKTDHDLEVGIREHYDYEDRIQQEDGYQIKSNQLIQTSVGDKGSNANRKIETEALALFLQDKIEYERFTFTPGVRYEKLNLRYSDFGKKDADRLGSELIRNYSSLDVIIPGIGTHYKLNDNVGLILGVHKGFAPPSPSKDDGIKEEESVNYEFGGIFDNGKVKSDITFFYNDYSNLLGADTLSAGGTGSGDLFNAGKSTVKGIETSVHYDLNHIAQTQKFSIPVFANYTFTDAQFDEDFNSNLFGLVKSGDDIPYIARHQTTTGIGVEYEKIGSYLRMFFLDSMPTIPGQAGVSDSPRTEAHAIFDLNTNYKLRKDTTIFFNIENLFDEEYMAARRPAGIRSGRPQTFLAGFRFSF